MFKNYFLIASRNLLRNKAYSFINILGFAIGMAACILIGLFVQHETSFDNNIPDRADVYRLNEYVHYDGTVPQLSAAIGPPIAGLLKSSHPEIQEYTRVFPATPFVYPSITLEYNGNSITSNKLACADPSFRDMFGVKLIEGDKNNFISDQNAIVLTKSFAAKFFGDSSALHKTITMRTRDTTIYVTVSNVIDDFSSNSHMQVDGLLPIPSWFENGFLGDNYGVLMGPTYLRLAKGINKNVLQDKLTKDVHEKNKFIDMQLQPVSELHTTSTAINYDYFNYNKIDGKYISVFIIIALAVFIIACINFINLTIAMAGYRGKEIAVKKVIGARRGHIVLQVFIETFVSVLASVLIAVLLTGIFLPTLNTILNRHLNAGILYQPVMIAIYGLILLFTTIIAGAYPAILISSSRANEALKSKMLFSGSRTTLRNIMVTGQFVVAVIFIISPIVFLKQLNFLQNKDLGYSYNQVIKVPLDVELADKLPILKTELLSIKGVSDISNGYLELGGKGSLFGVNYTAPDGSNKQVSVNFENAATNYVQFFGMKIIAGRDFKKDNPANEYLINETFAKQIGHENPIGKQIHPASFPPGAIVGVIKDFNYSSLHAKVEPILVAAVSNVPMWQSQLYIKVSTAGIADILKQVESKIKKASGNAPFTYQFMDDHFKEVYSSERQAGTMVAIIGGLAILIACLGLLSLAAFIIVKRTKEIGIRKVVGASVGNIAIMLSKDFIRLVLIAMIIAFPLSWWAMNNWLQNFAYRIHLGADVFVIAGLAITLLTLCIVSYQAIKAAVANPVKSLRTE